MYRLYTLMALVMMAMLAYTPAVSADVTAAQKKYHGWGQDVLAYNQQVEITNSVNFYRFNFLQNKPDAKGNLLTFMNISAPRQQWGFGRAPINFLSVEVNGIKERVLQPSESDFEVWNRQDRAGATVTLNFDGAKIFIDVHMKEDSPVLWLTFRQAQEQIEPVRSIRISLQAVISRLVVKDGTTVWSDIYDRRARTARGELEQRNEPYPLTAEDRYLILSDGIYDGSGPEKGFGPSFVAFDFDDVDKASLQLANRWMNQVDFHLKPDFKAFTVGIWQRKDAISNDAFLKLFEENIKTFVIE